MLISIHQSLPGLQLTIEGLQGYADMGMDDISLKPGACGKATYKSLFQFFSFNN